MKTIGEIQKEVGAWSLANFGHNESKAVPGLTLGSLGALLGMVEEFGELMNPRLQDADEIDAVGDILVYLCDYASREGFVLSVEGMRPTLEWPAAAIAEAIGKLAHCTLKRHQGIRGFDDEEKYESHRNEAINMLLQSLVTLCYEKSFGKQVEKILEETWTKVVSKRNWKQAPQDGGGFDHKDEASSI